MIKKKLGLGLFTLIGILVLIMVLILVRIKIEQGKLNPAKTQIDDQGIFVLQDSDFVNLYFIPTDHGYIGVDGGNNLKDIELGLSQLEIDPAKVHTLLLTHTDLDHTKAVSLFTEATIYIGSLEEQMINGETARFAFIHNQLTLPYKTLDDHEIITIEGIQIEALSTPGHTPGSTTYLVNDRLLFTGDCIGFDGTYATAFNDLFNMDSEKDAESIRLYLAPLEGIHTIYTGHHGIITVKEETFRLFRSN